MEIIVLLGIFLLGWFAGQIYVGFKLRQAIRKVAEDNGLTLEELQDMFSESKGLGRVIKVPNLFTESNNNSILLYNKDTGCFVAQANSLDQLAEDVYKFDKIKFALVKHNSQEFWFVEGKVKNDLKEIE